MKFFSAALQGSVLFVTLLIGQVVIVASLALTALWLYFKKLQNNNEEGEELQELDQNAARVSKEFARELERKIVALEEERAKYLQSDPIKELEGERTKAQELEKIGKEAIQKVQGLEARLLEYEVLKEEIGQLTQYKNEIQQLKNELKETQIKFTQTASTTNGVSVEVTGEAARVSQATLTQEEPDIKGLLNEIEALTSETEVPMKKVG